VRNLERIKVNEIQLHNMGQALDQLPAWVKVLWFGLRRWLGWENQNGFGDIAGHFRLNYQLEEVPKLR
jgi:hypothetical protein